ncbi:MAG TPA: DUF1972 domain-containing protein [Bacteroidetes bacterium]|nr:DUF1972 domain-containing protein [Bacteroidota bacterium]
MKIAIMGIRGIPANYGGFETFAEEIAPRLVRYGHEVTVYGRSNNINYNSNYYKGVKIKILPTIRHKYFDTVAHTFLCALHSLFNRYDAILICNSANSAFSWIPRLKGQKVVLNVDGLEWKRKKWNILGQWFYKISEYLATIFPNHIVSDAVEIQKYYLDKFKKKSTYIAYGAPTERVLTQEVLHKFDLKPRQYILYVSRLEPENNAHLVVKAFEKVRTDMKLVVVGDAPYNKEYIKKLKSTTDPRIVFTGYVFGKGYREFQSNAYIYIQATEVGGTHPALLEGMGFGNCVLANDVVEHREVLGGAGIYFQSNPDNEELRQKIQFLCDNVVEVEKYRALAQRRVKEKYTWEKVSRDYESLFFYLNNNHKRKKDA